MTSEVESRRAEEACCVFLDSERGNLCTRRMLYCVRSQFCGYRPKSADTQKTLVSGVASGMDKDRQSCLSATLWRQNAS